MRQIIICCLFLTTNMFAQKPISSDDVIVRLAIADNMAKSNQFDAALATYDDIVDFHPDYVDAYMRRGILLAKMGRIPEAIQDYNTAKQLDPYVVEVFDLSGRINKMKVLKGINVKNTEDAAKMLFEIKKKIKQNPQNSLLIYTGATLNVLLGDYSSALKEYNKAIELKKDFVEAIYNRGIVHIILGENTAACEDFLESSKMGSERGTKKYQFFCKK